MQTTVLVQILLTILVVQVQ